MICLDCGFDTDTADLTQALAILGDAEGRVTQLVDDLRRRTAAAETGDRDLDRVLRLCDSLEGARRALLGTPHRAAGRDARGTIPMYSALAMLSTQASWLQRASRSVSPRSPRMGLPPAVAETAHALEHASSRLVAPYSAGETSPLS